METLSHTRAQSCWSVILSTNLSVTSPGDVKQTAHGQAVNLLVSVSVTTSIVLELMVQCLFLILKTREIIPLKKKV